MTDKTTTVAQLKNQEYYIVRAADFNTFKTYGFVVIFARYKNKWLFCRAKGRDGFETAGGHIEPGEAPLEAAKRELYEETGAVGYDISPLFDYSAEIQNKYSTGQVFFAQISELGDLPAFEMEEVRLLDTLPEKMRFPQILPVLFERVKEILKSRGLQL